VHQQDYGLADDGASRRFAYALSKGVTLVHAEDLDQLGGEPQAARRAAEQVEGFREALPDPAVVGLDRRAAAGRHPDLLQGYPLAVKHAEDVVVGDDEQLGRGAQSGVRVCEQLRGDVPVRVHERQPPDAVVEIPRQRASGRIRGEEAVRRGCPANARHASVPPC
jgi:hypothetical protein